MSIIGTFMVPHPPLIIPEVGKGSEHQVDKTILSYQEIAKEIAILKPETIIISSPHAEYYSDYFYISGSNRVSGNFSSFGASRVTFSEEIDIELAKEIEKIAKKEDFPCGCIEDETLDHGTMVPLYFIRKELPKCKIIIVGLSTLPLIDNYHFGMIIKEAVNKLNKKVVFVSSGDLSHKLQEYGPYGFSKEGPIYDERIIDTMSKAKFNELLEYEEYFLEKAAECGHRSFTIMAGTLDGLDVNSKFLSHEDITGVGYGICSFIPKEKNKEREFYNKYIKKIIANNQSKDEYVNLAKKTINTFIKEKKKIDVPKDLSKELLNNKAGVFVSIHKFGQLRGCIGTFLPTTSSIAEEIINNAISASINDPRFPAITEDELDYLNINVDVLSLPTHISSKAELDPKKYGVIVTSGNKKGLLLPNIDGVDTIEEQINIAKNKAGIYKDEKYELEKFEVIRHE